MGATSVAFAQVVTIKDRQSGLPIEAATITSASPREITTTNTKGQAELSVFKGAERIEIRQQPHVFLQGTQNLRKAILIRV